MSHLENYAKTNTITDLELTSTPSAIKFYTNNGYSSKELVVIDVNGVDFPETRMIKTLTASNNIKSIKKQTMNIKFLSLLLAVGLIILTGCAKEEPAQTSELEQLGVLGTWKLETRVANGTTSLAVECCDFIEIKEDSQLDDLNGTFTSYGVGYETNGSLEISWPYDLMIFHFNNDRKSYVYKVEGATLTFNYTDEDEQPIVETWVKEE